MEGLLYAFAASIFWGINGIFLRVGLEREDVLSSTMTVMLTGSFLTFLVSLNDLSTTSFHPDKVIFLIAAGFISYFIARAVIYRSIPIVGSSRAYSASSTRILFSAILGVLILKEEMNLLVLSGTLLMVSGLYIFTTEEINVREFGISVAGGFLFGLSTLLIKLGMLESVFISLTIATFSGFIFLAFFCILTGRFRLVKNRHIFFSSITLTSGNVLFYYSLKMSPLVIAIPVSNLYPLITAFIGYFAIRDLEKSGLKTLIASLVTVSGSVLVSVGYFQ